MASENQKNSHKETYATQIAHVADMRRWIYLEQQKKVEEQSVAEMGLVSPENLARIGLAITSLKVIAVRPGLGDRLIITLTPSEYGDRIPKNTKFKRSGYAQLVRQRKHEYMKETKANSYYETVDNNEDEKGLRKDSSHAGVIIKLADYRLTMAIDDTSFDKEDFSGIWDMIQSSSSISYIRMNETMRKMESILKGMMDVENFRELHPELPAPWTGNSELVKKLLPPFSPSLVELEGCCDSECQVQVRFINKNLNGEQMGAVVGALESKLVYFIHGPPGTGKSQTLVEIVQQLVRRKKKVLVCGPSNGAVDNMLERLKKARVKCLRVVHPGRMEHMGLLGQVLSLKLQATAAGPELRQARKVLDRLLKLKNKGSRVSSKEIREARKDLRNMEMRATKELVKESEVVLTSLNGSGGYALDQQRFDVLIIDEATQALEPDCWIAMSKADKVILAGDHHQLPPTVLAKDESGLELTMFQRLIESTSPTDVGKIYTILNVQYRMNKTIMQFSSDKLYQSLLVADPKVANWRLNDLPEVVEKRMNIELIPPIVFVDTANMGYDESVDGQSQRNIGETELVLNNIRELLEIGVQQESIAVLSPYSGQVNLLKRRLTNQFPEVELGSVNSFQGRENEVVILSLVRSNNRNKIGFLNDYRRLNVAITRARRHLIIIGDSQTTMTDRANSPSKDVSENGNFLFEFSKYLEKNSEIRYPERFSGVIEIIGNNSAEEQLSQHKAPKPRSRRSRRKSEKATPPSIQSDPTSNNQTQPAENVQENTKLNKAKNSTIKRRMRRKRAKERKRLAELAQAYVPLGNERAHSSCPNTPRNTKDLFLGSIENLTQRFSEVTLRPLTRIEA